MSATNAETPYGDPHSDPHDRCASLAAFACKDYGTIAPFRRVEGGFQQRHCPDHPAMLPDRAMAPGS